MKIKNPQNRSGLRFWARNVACNMQRNFVSLIVLWKSTLSSLCTANRLKAFIPTADRRQCLMKFAFVTAVYLADA
jgi:hypothetical protein